MFSMLSLLRYEPWQNKNQITINTAIFHVLNAYLRTRVARRAPKALVKVCACAHGRLVLAGVAAATRAAHPVERRSGTGWILGALARSHVLAGLAGSARPVQKKTVTH